MFGMLISQMMRSGMLSRAISTPVVPSSADRVKNPYRLRDSAMIIRISSVSSMTRTFFPAAPVREVPLAGEQSGTVAVMRQKPSKSGWTVASGQANVPFPGWQKLPTCGSYLTTQARSSYSVSMFSLKALLAALVLAIGVPIAFSQTNPVRLATTARIDLTSPNVNLTNGQVVSGTGQIKRADWLSSSAQPRSYSAEFTINHLGWHEVGLRFVPTANGTVDCNLMGPWGATANGRVYKQEVLWDAVQVTGAELSNGSFENTNEGWRSGAVLERAPASLPAVHGQHYGRAWHNQPLRTTLEVTAGTPVVLRAQARAVLPPNQPEMRRIADRNSPAHVAARRFLRGANFGNFLEVPPSQTWVVPHTITDLKRMRAEGFDHVRIPVDRKSVV